MLRLKRTCRSGTSMTTKVFHDALLYIFPKDCFEQLVLQVSMLPFLRFTFQANIFHPECAPLVLSRALGLAITLGSLMLFLPQVHFTDVNFLAVDHQDPSSAVSRGHLTGVAASSACRRWRHRGLLLY